MNNAAQFEWLIQRPRWIPWLALWLAVVILGGTLTWAALDLRARIRTQMIQRDGEILDAVTLMQHLNDQTAGGTIAPLTDPGEQIQLALEVSRLRNVLGVRLYTPGGKFVNAFPAYITELPLPAADWAPLGRLQPVSRFAAHARMDEQDLLADTNQPTAALWFVEVPLRTDDQRHLAGVIQFMMDGSGLAERFDALDRELALKFSLAFAVGAGLLVAGLGLALHRVQHANRKLAERTGTLLQANRELALAARTSAVGAVASHLIHGLKNPLSGLRHFVDAGSAEHGRNSPADWQAALNTAQRMEELINCVVRVLQERQMGTEYEITAGELAGMLRQKAGLLADAAGVHFEARLGGDRTLSNREADLILLILENLVQNAIQATPPGRSVEVRITEDAGALVFDVRDQGPGLPEEMLERLFMPCVSGKTGGGGIGLAISKQLAQTLGAQLELAVTSAAGCIFRLTVPAQPQLPVRDEKVVIVRTAD